MALSDRDLDGDGILNIFDSTPYPPTTNPPNPLPQRNVAGFQEGSIYTNTTLSAEDLTPAQSSTTVLSPVGVMEPMANWATEVHQSNRHLP